MPSPDVTPYLPLELIDVDAQELTERALADVSAKLPEWTPREGLLEVVLLEALALEVSETVYAINRLPGGLAEVLLRLFGLDRDQGAPPTADVTFTVADTTGHTIPAGTVVRLDLDGSDPLDLATTADLTIAPGSSSGTISATGSEPTLEANGRPAGTVLELVDALPYVDTVVLAAAAAGGRLAEDGDTFLSRAIVRLSRLTTTLVRPADFEAYLAEVAGVTRVRVLDLYNPADPGTPPGGAPGYVTVAVAGPGGSSLTADARAVLATELRARAHAGLSIDVVDANVTTVPVSIRVQRYPGSNATDVATAVRAALTGYLNPDAWPFTSTVRVNELIGRADAAAGVDTVLEVTDPATDVTLPGVAPLARAGTITVVVDDPA